MKISVCMSFFQRQELYDRTLETIRKSKAYKDIEIIVADDASEPPLQGREAKVITIQKKDKWYHNPCIPYNLTFKEAKGDIIIIQNPECMHVGDVLKYALDNVRDGVYVSFGCYAINDLQTRMLRMQRTPEIEDKKFDRQKNGWYNHPVHRPVGYHFCSAITRNDLEKIGGGFDERYANGVAFDDDALIRSIRRAKIEVVIPINPFVIHQFHTHFTYDDPKVWMPLHSINQNLFNNT